MNKEFLEELKQEVEERLDEYGVSFERSVSDTTNNWYLTDAEHAQLKEYCEELDTA